MRSLVAAVPLVAGITLFTSFAHRRDVPPPVNRTISVTAHDFSFAGLPAHVPAGWLTMRMANAGKELHMIATFSLPRGYTAAGLLDSLIHERYPADLTEWGGPNAVAPGDTNTVTLHLPAGEYVVGCFVVSPDGKTHFMKGMMGSFDVVPSSDTGSAPAFDRHVTLSSYKIAVDGAPITRGIHTLLVRNVASANHDFVILRVLPKHTVAETLNWFTNPPTGEPAAIPVGGTTSLHSGETGFVRADFTPGTYVMVCWLTTKDKYHYRMGMEDVFTVPAT